MEDAVTEVVRMEVFGQRGQLGSIDRNRGADGSIRCERCKNVTGTARKQAAVATWVAGRARI
jgi:hypothetical protein